MDSKLPDAPVAKIFVYQGIDRFSSELMLESSPERLLYFPVIATPLTMAMNFIDDAIVGGLGKRPGFKLYLDNPDNQPVQVGCQYTTLNGATTQEVRQSGTNLYVTSSSTTWGASTYTLTGNNIPGMFTQAGGYLFYVNGTDPILMWDATRWYQIVNGAVTATLSATLNITDTTATISPISFNTTGANFPPQGFVQNGAEIIQYTGFTLNGGGQITALTGLIRNYANSAVQTTVAAASNGASLPTGTITVASTTGFAASGTLSIVSSAGNQTITYTGLTTTTFTGCTGGTGTLATLNSVTPLSTANGNTLPVYYGSPPVTPKYLVYGNGRMYAFATATYPNGVIWSASVNETTSPYNWIIDQANPASIISYSGFNSNFIPGNGGVVTSVDGSGQNVLVYKGTNCSLMTVDTYARPQSLVSIDNSMGSLTQKTIANIQGSQFSFGYNGSQVYNGQGLQLISKPIDDLAKGASLASPAGICSNGYDYKLFIAVPSTTEADRFGAQTYTSVIFVYNYLTSYWFIWQTPFTINAMWNMVDANGRLQMYVGDTAGKTYVWNPDKSHPIFSDNTQPIAAYIKTKYLYFNDPTKQKQYKDITVISEAGKNASLSFSTIRDDLRTDYQYQMPIPGYITKLRSPDLTAQHYAVSYLISEGSFAPFYFYGITQEFEYKGGVG